MAGVVIELLLEFWNAWGIQAVVLLSFTLQVILLVMADFRRHRESHMLKVIIWTAYVLADTTAVYALGHMSVMGGLRRLPEHELMALWAPLLLVHLGGQDNITAYAIEDNQLWLRHLQIFSVQVVAAAYILYGSSIVLTRQTRLLDAAILMFVVGVLKYGERVWALMRASGSASSSLSATSYKKADFSSIHQHKPRIVELVPTASITRDCPPRLDEADFPLVAYRLLDVPKQLFERPTRYVEVDNYYGDRFDGEEMLQVVRIQLQMMYDLLYTKAGVLHTWYGWSMRAISLLATVAALLLFHFRAGAESAEDHQDQDGGSGGSSSRTVDVAITYVLVGGAVVLHMVSLLRAVFSSWTYVHMREGKWFRLAGWARPVTSRYTSAVNMGQHSLCWISICSKKSKSSKVARWMGREDWWDSRFHSWFTPVSPLIIRKVVEVVSRDEDVTSSLDRNGILRYGIRTDRDMELDETILVWHVATQVYLARRQRRREEEDEVINAADALSNYLFFLLAARPSMLPYPVSRQRYVQLCYDVITHFKSTSLQELSLEISDTSTISPNANANPTLSNGLLLATTLPQKAAADDNSAAPHAEVLAADSMLLNVWVELLCYTAYRCNENSHAKHLSSGGELMTTVALLMLYKSRGLIITKEWPQVEV